MNESNFPNFLSKIFAMQNSTAYQNINKCAEWAKRTFWENVRSSHYKSKLELNKGYCFLTQPFLQS